MFIGIPHVAHIGASFLDIEIKSVCALYDSCHIVVTTKV
jgi:hypothetical protein